MEVKVWMDGIQLVVCGVTDQTTCRDIMVAIAHATGKTGRYTMIEKWMENERNLCGTDVPLRILHKYGEYASDIQFILRHSNLATGTGRELPNEKALHRIGRHQESRPSSRKIKKSLTFNCAMNAFPLTDLHSISTASQNCTDMRVNHSLESSEQSSIASHSSASASPCPSLERLRRNVSQQNAVFSESKSHGVLSSFKPNPPHTSPSGLPRPVSTLHQPYNNTEQTTPNGKPSRLPLRLEMLPHCTDPENLSKEKKRPTSVAQNHLTLKESPVHEEHKSMSKLTKHTAQRTLSSDSAVSIKSSSSNSTSPRISNSRSAYLATSHADSETAGENEVVSYHENLKKFQKMANEQNSSSRISPAKSVNKLEKKDFHVVDQFLQKGVSTKNLDSEVQQNLLALIGRQKTELENQDSRLASLNTEIYMLEMDLEVDDKQLAMLSDQLKELEEMENEAENEIQDLELVSWDEKLHMEKQKEQRMRTEIMLLQSSILKSESEISRIEKKIKLLTGDIDSANRANQESKQKEEKTMLTPTIELNGVDCSTEQPQQPYFLDNQSLQPIMEQPNIRWEGRNDNQQPAFDLAHPENFSSDEAMLAKPFACRYPGCSKRFRHETHTRRHEREQHRFYRKRSWPFYQINSPFNCNPEFKFQSDV